MHRIERTRRIAAASDRLRVVRAALLRAEWLLFVESDPDFTNLTQGRGHRAAGCGADEFAVRMAAARVPGRI